MSISGKNITQPDRMLLRSKSISKVPRSKIQDLKKLYQFPKVAGDLICK